VSKFDLEDDLFVLSPALTAGALFILFFVIVVAPVAPARILSTVE
jgi:hypothetical protein